MELITVTGKLNECFLQLEMFDVCTTGDTAHIDTILKFLPHTHLYECLKARIIAAVKKNVCLGQPSVYVIFEITSEFTRTHLSPFKVCVWGGEDIKEGRHLEDLGVDGRIILKFI
jgi:hypothetical protein